MVVKILLNHLNGGGRIVFLNVRLEQERRVVCDISL